MEGIMPNYQIVVNYKSNHSVTKTVTKQQFLSAIKGKLVIPKITVEAIRESEPFESPRFGSLGYKVDRVDYLDAHLATAYISVL